ncbi:hypothetical protein AZJ48_08435 [Streptococcus pneumoniae]|nr:hypothetical protein AZJ48_08435 [Streptococcus pneumoniae]
MSLFIIDDMGLFFYPKIGSIISIGDLPTTNIIEPGFMAFFVSSTKKVRVLEGYKSRCTFCLNV